jgi:uncharacterized membrane protein
LSASHGDLSVLGFRLIVIGFLLSFIGFVLITIGSLEQMPGFTPTTSASTGIVIFIGPFPLIIGSGPQGPLLIIAGLIIVALMILLTVLIFRERVIRSWIKGGS